MKKCNKCQGIKEEKYFNKSGFFKSGKVKYTSDCKECRKKHYIENKDSYITSAKNRYCNNREEILKQMKTWQGSSLKPKEWRVKNQNYLQQKSKEWYYSNRDRSLKTQYEWRLNNKKYASEWQKTNKDKVKQYNKKADAKKRKERPWVIAWRNQLSGVLKRLKQKNQPSTLDSLKYSPQQLKEHLELLWLKGMSWSNYGRKIGCWEIDHIKPVSKFDANTEACIVNSLDNLNPLWVTDNRRKGNIYIEEKLRNIKDINN